MTENRMMLQALSKDELIHIIIRQEEIITTKIEVDEWVTNKSTTEINMDIESPSSLSYDSPTMEHND
ncbi:unnamed protein product [Rotaria sordida]|uniref:Uncharacterized protein n=1 Tax=Rotaria sordida TaxID=392033 RepID=A0A814LXK7_9BILA|nr:unnamed protein product [Rotaria sordida]CAF1071654.1 unnamed protein product [Rotaria sordida]CAF1094029.1 unnamed protein product [Rotaria sordida]CAF1099989.1 unnamed protein product [Rotaria sordida]CAF3682488.1 unnamed protein product [Rotaria sordida]